MKLKFYPALMLLCLCSLYSSVSAQATVDDWTYQSSLNATRVCFSSPLNGIGCSLSGSLQTTDGGQTWNVMTGQSDILTDVAAPSAQHIIGISYTNIWVDFGTGFVSDGTAGGEQLNALFFLDDNHGWTAQNDGIIQVTVNGGTTWNRTSSGNMSTVNCTAIAFTTSTNGVVGTNAGSIFYTTNNSSSWTAATTPGQLTSDYTISRIRYLNSTTLIATAASQSHQDALILRSTDGGLTWTIVHTNTSEVLTDVAFKDANTGYAVGFLFAPRNSPSPSLIYKTTDAGQTWTQLPFSDFEGCDFYGITFYDSTHGWIMGEGCSYKYSASSPNGIDETEAAVTVSLYPDPASTTMHVISGYAEGQACNYEVMDVTGKTILTGLETKANFDIAVNTLTSGLYIIKLKSGNNTIVKKFLKD